MKKYLVFFKPLEEPENDMTGVARITPFTTIKADHICTKDNGQTLFYIGSAENEEVVAIAPSNALVLLEK